MDADATATAVRQRRIAERIGGSAVCYFCGYRNPVALMRRNRTLLQADHIYGRERNRELTVAMCRNCHAEITEDRRCEGIPMRRERDPIERSAYMLAARAVFLEKDAKTMRKLAADLFRVVDARRRKNRKRGGEA